MCTCTGTGHVTVLYGLGPRPDAGVRGATRPPHRTHRRYPDHTQDTGTCVLYVVLTLVATLYSWCVRACVRVSFGINCGEFAGTCASQVPTAIGPIVSCRHVVSPSCCLFILRWGGGGVVFFFSCCVWGGL